MGKISFDVNNGGKLNICQAKHDGSVSVSTGESKGYNISAGDFVMLLMCTNGIAVYCVKCLIFSMGCILKAAIV